MKQAVLIMVDTQRQDMLSCYDADAAPTPVLDALAREWDAVYQWIPPASRLRPGAVRDFYRALPAFQRMIANSMQLGANTKTAGGMAQPAWD